MSGVSFAALVQFNDKQNNDNISKLLVPKDIYLRHVFLSCTYFDNTTCTHA